MDIQFVDGNLSYIGQDLESIPAWLAKKYGEETVRIDLSFNQLRSLKGLVGFDSLRELVLDNNQIGDDAEFPLLENLEILTINKNKISDLENFLQKVTNSLPNLTYLSMLGNEACPNQLISSAHDDDDYKRYRYYILSNIPMLRFLDSTPVMNEERKEAARVGQFMKIVRVNKNSLVSNEEESPAKGNESYTPLPSSKTKEGRHHSSFGKCTYVYYGKHSEGNRFIGDGNL